MDKDAFSLWFEWSAGPIALRDQRGRMATGVLKGYDDLGVCLDMGDHCETFFPWTSVGMLWNGEPARLAHEHAKHAKARLEEFKATMEEIEDDDGPRPALSAEEITELLERFEATRRRDDG